MSTLFGRQVKDTYLSVLTLDNGFIGSDGNIWPVQSGDGVNTCLSLGTTALTICGIQYPTTDGPAGYGLVTDGNGNLSFAAQGANSLANLSDVTLAGPASNEFLKYNGADWVNSTIVAAHVTDLDTATVTFSNKSGNISQWTNDTGYVTASSSSAFTNKTGNISQWTNDSGYLTVNQNLTGPITSVGVATSVASQTGSGSTFVMDTSPVLVTPTLGVATATSLNKVTFTAPATTATLTIANNQTLTVNGSTILTNGTHSGTNTGDQNLFTKVAVSGQSDVVSNANDTLNFAAGANVTITTTPGTNTVTIASTGGGGGGTTLADGNYGDVTASSSGTVITINSEAVTYAKIQDVSATDMLLGRSTVGAGVVEEIPCTAAGRALLDDANAAAQRVTLSAAALGANTDITSVYLDNTGLKVKDTNASHGLIIAPGSDLTADRTLTVTTGDADRTLTLSASTTLNGGTHSGTNTGDQTTVSGNAGTVTVGDAASDASTWVLLGTSQTGSLAPATDSGLTYNATTDALTTTTFIGSLTGNASGSSGSCTGNAATATALATPRAIGGVNFDGTAAITPANITIANEATDITCFPLFATAATGDLPPRSNTNLTFNSNTANLACTTFTGALVGNASTVTTNANLTGVITSAGNATSIASQTGTGTKFVVDNTPTLITPVLGVATATSVNKVAITAPATSATLTIANSQTLTVNGSTTLTSGTHSGTNTGDQTITLTGDVTGSGTGSFATTLATVTVPKGGTGVTTMTTAYAPVCAGTTATGALQVASTGLSTSGYVLTSNGASALPSFQATSKKWVWISTTTAATSATVDITGLTSTYKDFLIVFDHVKVATAGANLQLRVSTDNGATYVSGAGTYGYACTNFNSSTSFGNSNSATFIQVSPNISASADKQVNGYLFIHSPQTADNTHINGQNTCWNNAGNATNIIVGGMYLANTAVNGIRFLMSAGNINSGDFTLYGMINS